MKLLPSDPDIQTIVVRIKSGDLDLQPDFQRGEVWSDAKKRRLIDTILRDWHIPPIHVIERPDSHQQEVLDGQQRLAAIRDFVNGLIRVDGSIEPIEHEIEQADECTYETLPPNLRRRFDRFTMRVFRLVDFLPDEPGELFFRLNQPTSLTAAEQRNAFFGPVRQQVRTLCDSFAEYGISDSLLGFSNSRMAYDDIVAKLCLTCERRTLRQKITASTITERYRLSKPFESDVIKRSERALKMFGRCAAKKSDRAKFNKATLFSWLCLFCRDVFESENDIDKEGLTGFLSLFEEQRLHSHTRKGRVVYEMLGNAFPLSALQVFTDRASLRVGDVASVLLRDATLAYCYVDYSHHHSAIRKNTIQRFEPLYDAWKYQMQEVKEPSESDLLGILDSIHWGHIV